MIVRAWRGLAAADRPDAYAEQFRRNVLPELKAIDGFLGVSLLRRQTTNGFEFLVLTRWKSMDAIRAFAGKDVGRAVVEPQAMTALVDYDRTVAHYEVLDES
jgi:heme-degrading monooxygenase HmoA